MTQLAERLQSLTLTGRFSNETVAALGEFLSSAPEEAVFRINPLSYGRSRGLSERDAIDLFVYASRHGLCEFSWDVFCVMCGSVLRTAEALRKLEQRSQCALCDIEVTSTLDEAVEVAFTVSPAVRSIRFHRPNDLRGWADLERLAYSENRLVTDEAKARFLASVLFGEVLAPGEVRTVSLALDPGTYRILAVREHAGTGLVVGEGGRVIRAELSDGSLLLSPRTAMPGPVEIQIHNNSRQFQPVTIFHRFWTSSESECGLREAPGDLRGRYQQFLTGKRLLTSQSFRDLFRAESISPGSSFDLREATFMFTDLKGSTELYDRIGDLADDRLVREHFHILEGIVAEHEGAVVKTIGDAIMATFSGARKAVQAAQEMHDRMEVWNRDQEAGDLLLKIGIHDGPCIAVDSNDRLDYFGQTVNMAARIQGLAQARETYFSDSVFGAPGVGEYVQSCGIELAPVTASLKGISEEVAVYRM